MSMIMAVRTIIWVFLGFVWVWVFCWFLFFFFNHALHVLPSSECYLESAEKTKLSNIYYTVKIYTNFENQASS